MRARFLFLLGAVSCSAGGGAAPGAGGTPGSVSGGGSAPLGGSPSGGTPTGLGGASSGGAGTATGGASPSGGATGSGGAGATAGGSGGSVSGGATPGGSPGGGGGEATGGVSPGGAGQGAGGDSGGMSAGAGAGGDNGGGGAGTGGSAGPCSAPGLILCETFDDLPLGEKPSGGPWMDSDCFDTSHVLEVDNGQAHSGTQSLVSQGIPYGACMLHASLGGATDFWVRTWVRFAAGAADQFSAHEVVVYDLTPTTDTDDPGIRVGFRGDSSCQPTGAEVNITGGEEQTGCTGFQFVADTWYCLELHVAPAAGGGVTTDFFIDGADQSYDIHGTPTMTVDNPDYAGAQYLRLGTRSYSSVYMPDVHVDDMAIGTERIGCP